LANNNPYYEAWLVANHSFSDSVKNTTDIFKFIETY